MGREHDRFARLEARLESLERRLDALETLPASGAAPIGRVPPPPTGPPLGMPSAPNTTADATPDAAPTATFARQRRPALPEGRTVARVTGLALVFLAAVFGISTAIDRGWIGPEVQLALAVGFGLSLCAIAIRPPRPLAPGSSAFAVTGVGVLFAATGGGREWLELYGFWPAFAGWGVVALASLVLARHLDRQRVAVLVLPLLLFTLLWTRAPRDLGDLGFAAVIAAVALAHHALGIERGWQWTSSLAALATGLLHLIAAAEVERDPGTAVLVGGQLLLVGTALAHWFAPTLIVARIEGREGRRAGRPGSSVEGGSAAGVAARSVLVVPLWAWGTTTLLHDLGAGTSALVAAIVAALALASTVVTASESTWLASARLGGVAAVAAAGVGRRLEGSALLAGLTVVAVMLLALEHRRRDTWLRVQAVGLAAGVVLGAALLTVKAIVGDAAFGDDLVHLGVFAIVVLGGVIAAHPGLVAVGYVGLLGWLASVLVHLPQGQVLLSIAWAGTGVGLVLVGVWRRRPRLARLGAATLGLVVTKMITVDLAEVDTFWRAGLFLLVGAGLVWLSARLAEPGGPQPSAASSAGVRHSPSETATSSST